MELKVLNKLENALFSRSNPSHVPTSGRLVFHALIGGAIISLIVFVLQMTSIGNGTVEIIAGILLAGLFGYMGYKCLSAIKEFPGWGGRIGYVVYMAVLTFLSFYLAMMLVMVALLGIFLYVIVKVFFGGSKKGKWKVRYSDGTEEEAEEVGIGICGEKYVSTKDGVEHIVP